MASKTNTATLVTADVDFEPYCEWQKDEGSHTLIVHTPDFKKDQLRVQVNNLGVLKVSGARPADGGRMSRFVKETKIPQGCHIIDILAKFVNGRLHVIMPKKVTAPPQVLEPAPMFSAPPQAPKSEATQKPEAEALVPNDQKLKSSPSAENGKTGATTCFHQANDHVFGIGRPLARLHVGKKVSVSFGMAMLAMVAIGIYTAYKCSTDTSCPPPARIEDYIQM